MRVLLTRPRADSEALASRLSRRGFDCVIEPLLTVRMLAAPDLDVDGVQALLVTSANGARALARNLADGRDLPLFAVGGASARAAREEGFTHVFDADGDVKSLARLVRDQLDPKAGALLHAAGEDVAGDLAGELGGGGFEVRRTVLYRAEPAAELSPALRAELAAGAIGAVLLYSPRTARTFVRLLCRQGLQSATARTAALCLSDVVASELRELRWARILIAESPTQSALVRLLESMAGARE